MPRILLIHGIAQQYNSGPKLAHDWWLALKGGLEVAGYSALAHGITSADVEVAFFGDLFRPQIAKAGAEVPYTSADINPGLELDLMKVWYQAVAEQDPTLAPEVAVKAFGSVPAQMMLHRLLRSRTLAGVAERAFIGHLKQVTAYLSDDSVKEHVLQLVNDRITPDTAVIIGHSLGSIIAYEFLVSHAPSQVNLFVSVGSPLGIRNLIFDRLTPRPVGNLGAWPGETPKWVNIADKDDVVALCKNLAPLFSSGDRYIDDQPVDNGRHPHRMDRYLSAVETGAALGAVL